METEKVYLVKSLSPWMMTELLAFSELGVFSLWLLREPAEQYLKDISVLRKRGVEVLIKPFSSRLRPLRLLLAGKFVLSNLRCLCLGYSAVVGWKSLYWFLRLDERFLNGNVSIHAQFATQPALLAYLIKDYRKGSASYTFTFHAYDIYFNNKWFSLLARHSEKAFSISEFNTAYIKERFTGGSSKIHLSRLGVEKQANRDRRLPAHFLAIGFMGRLVEKKGLRFLLKAVKILQADGQDIRLFIAGEGPLKADLEKDINELALENVKLLGGLEGKAEKDFFRGLDVFVMPSIQLKDDMDGVPVVMMEALSYGIPTIGTEVSGLPEICVPGYNGILVPPADPEALAAAISRLNREPETRRIFGKNAEKILERFDLRTNSLVKMKMMRWLN